MTIPLELKAKCAELYWEGMGAREIYAEHFCKEHEGMSFDTFRRKLRTWRKRQYAESDTLYAGTYAGFTAHNATVQVGADGSITQAWIKQSAEDVDWEAVAEVGDYNDTFARVGALLRQRRWAEVNFIIGQDLIHNNDLRGNTAKGTRIERVDIPAAWADAQRFYFPLIELATAQSGRVRLLYSKGNHDECISWCFIQALKARYPAIEVDDTLAPRKCISWRGCFIGFTHGNGARSRNNDLRSQFTIEFPMEFAAATVREIHAGHLHSESEGDLYGVMVRRLGSGVPTDEWNDNEGYIGAHKRFMVFEYTPGRLSAIHYV